MLEAHEIRTLSVLIVRVQGIGIGLDTEQLTGMIDLDQSSKNQVKLLNLHDLLGTAAGGNTHSKVLLIKKEDTVDLKDAKSTCMEQRTGVVVEQPEAIVNIPFDRIRPLPRILQASCHRGGFLAIACLPSEMIFIADIRKMMGGQWG